MVAGNVLNRTVNEQKKKITKVGYLETGQVYLLKVFEKQQSWVVEMSGLSMRIEEMRHSYVFPREFGIDQVISEASDMYNDLASGWG